LVEEFDQSGVDAAVFGFLPQDGQGLGPGQGRFVVAGHGDGVVDVHDGDDAALEEDGLGLEAGGITRAVQAFVVLGDDGKQASHVAGERDVLEDAEGFGRMAFDFPAFLGGEVAARNEQAGNFLLGEQRHGAVVGQPEGFGAEAGDDGGILAAQGIGGIDPGQGLEIRCRRLSGELGAQGQAMADDVEMGLGQAGGFGEHFLAYADLADIVEQPGVEEFLQIARAENDLGKIGAVVVHDPGQGHAQAGHPVGMPGGEGVTGVDGRGQGLHEGIDQGLDGLEVQGIAEGDARHGGQGADMEQMAGFEAHRRHAGQHEHAHATARGDQGGKQQGLQGRFVAPALIRAEIVYDLPLPGLDDIREKGGVGHGGQIAGLARTERGHREGGAAVGALEKNHADFGRRIIPLAFRQQGQGDIPGAQRLVETDGGPVQQGQFPVFEQHLAGQAAAEEFAGQQAFQAGDEQGTGLVHGQGRRGLRRGRGRDQVEKADRDRVDVQGKGVDCGGVGRCGALRLADLDTPPRSEQRRGLRQQRGKRLVFEQPSQGYHVLRPGRARLTRPDGAVPWRPGAPRPDRRAWSYSGWHPFPTPGAGPLPGPWP